MSKLLQAFFNDTLRGLVTLVVSLLVACPISILFILVPLWEDNRYRLGDWPLIAAFVLWEMIFIGGISAIIFFVSRQRKKWLDSVFGPLGLTGRRYLMNWWEYRGVVGGRQVAARFYRGPTLEISVQTGLKTRFGIAEADQPGLFLVGTAQQRPLRLFSPELQSLRIFALDEAWTAGFLDSAEAAAPVSRLMQAGESWALIRQVQLLPGQLRLTLYRNKNLAQYAFTAAEVGQWLADLAALAGLGESLSPPAKVAEESRVEAAARSGKTTRYAVGILVGFFAFCGIGIGVLLWLLVAFGG